MGILAAPVMGIIFSVMACCTTGDCFSKSQFGIYPISMNVCER